MKAAAMTPLEKARDRVEKRTAAGLTTATPERLAKAGVEGDGYEHTATNVQRIVEAPLDRLWKAGFITQREFEAGENLRKIAHVATIDPSPQSVDLSRVGGGFAAGTPSMFASQEIANARKKWRRIRELVPERSTVWTMLWLGVVKEVTLTDLGVSLGIVERKEAIAAGKSGFRVALSAFADVIEHEGPAIKA